MELAIDISEVGVMKMKMYKVALQIDTGYEWLNRTCILYANSKENAALKANTYQHCLQLAKN